MIGATQYQPDGSTKAMAKGYWIGRVDVTDSEGYAK